MLLSQDAGYNDLKEYTDFMNTHVDINKVKVPILSINCKDDMLCPPDAIPLGKIVENKNWIHINTGGGGHVEFCSGISAKMVRLK